MGKTTEGGRNIFEAAATFGYRGVKYFVEHKGVPVTSTNTDNRTAAHIAAQQGKLDVVKYLLGKDSSLLNAVDSFGYTIYHLAVINGALNVVTYLLDDLQVDLLQSNENYYKNTPVHFAAESGQLQILRYFIETKNCDINVLNSRGQPPAFLAARRRQTKIIKYIAEVLTNFTGLTAIDNNKKNILFMSATIGDLSIPKLLLSKYKLKLDVNQRDDTGATISFWASKLGHFDFLKYIVSWQHADINIADNDGRTPLHEATGEGHVFVTKYLIERGANKTVLDKNGMSPKDCTSDENVLVVYKKVGRKRSRRSVHHSFQFLHSNAKPQHRLYPPLQICSVQLSRNFGALSRIEGVITLISDLMTYFSGNQQTTLSEWVMSPKMIVRSKIDFAAIDAVNADFDFED